MKDELIANKGAESIVWPLLCSRCGSFGPYQQIEQSVHQLQRNCGTCWSLWGTIPVASSQTFYKLIRHFRLVYCCCRCCVSLAFSLFCSLQNAKNSNNKFWSKVLKVNFRMELHQKSHDFTNTSAVDSFITAGFSSAHTKFFSSLWRSDHDQYIDRLLNSKKFGWAI